MPDMIAAWASGFSLSLLIIAYWMIIRTSSSVVRLEVKLDALLKQSGVDLAAYATREAETLVKAGKKIEAIKVYRECTGVGLAEAKAAVERLQ